MMDTDIFSYPHNDLVDPADYTCLVCGATVREGYRDTHSAWHMGETTTRLEIEAWGGSAQWWQTTSVEDCTLREFEQIEHLDGNDLGCGPGHEYRLRLHGSDGGLIAEKIVETI